MILTRQRPFRRPIAAVGLAVTGLLLTGCGSSLGVHPGTAAVVGSDSVSMDTIDSTTQLYCKAYVASQKASSQQQSGPAPMGLFRSYVAGGLAKRLLGRQLADQYAVQPASGYQAQVSQIQSALSAAPADQRNAVIDVAASDAYLQNVQIAIGQQLTNSSGSTNAELKAALERGEVATQEWLDDHHVVVDPVFSIAVDGGKFARKVDQTSYALSSFAAQGAQSTPDGTYISALPAAQRCG